jgi:O-antigen/teichoic acid export membrane protein
MEMNTRVDVVFIGYFLGDHEVGVYSFAAMLADGMVHLLAVVRNNLTPITVALIGERRDAEAERLIQRVRNLLMPGFAGLSVAVVTGFALAVGVLAPGRGLDDGILPLAVLLLGLTFVSSLVPFDATLIAGGRPGLQTLQQFVVFATNVVLNTVLIPLFGITGAALGTAGACLVGGTVLVGLCRWTVGWNLVTGRVARRGAVDRSEALAAARAE